MGVFGFLALTSGTEKISGNFGIMDQQLALRWVQKNGAVFGGDPDNVVIWGQVGNSSDSHSPVLSCLMNRQVYLKVMTASRLPVSVCMCVHVSASGSVRWNAECGCDECRHPHAIALVDRFVSQSHSTEQPLVHSLPHCKRSQRLCDGVLRGTHVELHY
jgi:hypothetical protein